MKKLVTKVVSYEKGDVMMSKPGRKLSLIEIFANVGILVFLVFTIFPIAWMLFSSIKPPNLVFATPPIWLFTPTADNYKEALGMGSRGWGKGMPLYFLNSLIIAVTVTILNLIVGSMAGYGMARYKVGGKVLPLAFLLGKMLPPTVLILPFFLIIKKLGLSDSHLGLIMTYTAISLPFSVWMAWSFFLDLSRDIEEAALVDGCSKVQSIIKVLIPLASPGLIAIGILIYVNSWNEFLFAMTLTGLKVRTLPVAASLFITDEAILWGPMTATGTIIMSVPVLLTIFAQKYVISGLSAGAVKG